MINHAYTLLRNRRGEGADPEPGGAYTPPAYAPVAVPEGVERARRILFGAAPDAAYLRYRLWQYMSLLHSGDYAGYVYALDPRVTYWPRRGVPPFAFGSGVAVSDGSAPMSLQGAVEVDDATGRGDFTWKVVVKPAMASAPDAPRPPLYAPAGDASGAGGALRLPLSARSRMVQREASPAPPSPARRGAVLGALDRIVRRLTDAEPPPIEPVTAPGRRHGFLGQVSHIIGRTGAPAAPVPPPVEAPARRAAVLGGRGLLVRRDAVPVAGPPPPVGPFLVEVTTAYGLDPAFPTVTTLAEFTDGLSAPIPLPGSRLAIRLSAGAQPGDVGVVSARKRPGKDLIRVAAELREASRSFATDVFGALPAGPFATFAGLWFEHEQLPEQLAGLLLAIIHRTEDYRTR